MKYCVCGCKQLIENTDKRGRPHFFVSGHNKSQLGNFKDNIKEAASRNRARSLAIKSICFINNKDCSKTLDIAHLDQNPFNNNPNNLVCLCRRHHQLLDRNPIGLTINSIRKVRLIFKIKKSNGRRIYDWMAIKSFLSTQP